MKIHVNREDYVDHEYNGTITNERCIEIALARRWMQEHPNFVEVGAVMPYYGHTNHVVYDPLDPYDKCIKEYAEKVDFTGKEVLSVSTVEHMGNTWGYGPYFKAEDNFASQNFLEKLFRECDSLFVTVPVGCHPFLSAFVLDNVKRFNAFVYHKLNQEIPVWILGRFESEADVEFTRKRGYASQFPCANSIIFLTKNVVID